MRQKENNQNNRIDQDKLLTDVRLMVEKLRQLPREKLMYIKGSIDMAALPDETKPEAAHNQKGAEENRPLLGGGVVEKGTIY